MDNHFPDEIDLKSKQLQALNIVENDIASFYSTSLPILTKIL